MTATAPPTPLRRVAGRVWLYPADPDPARVQPSVAIVADERGSVLVDAGNSPDHARRVRAAMGTAGLPAARWLVYTHHHWDHVWGACAWPEVEIIGHAAGRDVLAAEATLPWSRDFLRQGAAANPRLGPSYQARARAMDGGWADFAVVPPHRVCTDTLTLPTGVHLRHVGGRHTADSTVVEVPDSGVVMLGDCYYPPPLHLRGPDDGPDLDQLRGLLDERYEWYVESHDDPWRRADALARLGP